MAKSEKTTYAPGELSRVREKLGVIDRDEANELAKKLGGEVGFERSDDDERGRSKQGSVRHEKVNVKIGDRPTRGIPGKRIELAPEAEKEYSQPEKKISARKGVSFDDDPSVPLRVSYWNRVKMDRFAGQPEFDIKSPGQVLNSIFSLFMNVPDYVSPSFIRRRMPEYYSKIEILVLSTRTLLPRNNARRSERVKKSAPLVYAILDAIRYWEIEKISGDLSRIQTNPKSAKVSDFAGILQAVYKPLFILDRLDSDAHIRGAYKILYKFLYIENPMEAQGKYQELIRTALAAYSGIRRDIHYLLYPLLMKTVSATYVHYDLFFDERKRRIMSFLNVTENDQLDPAELTMQGDVKDLKPEAEEEPQEDTAESGEGERAATEEEKSRRLAQEAEKKALDRGLQTLEALFPKAGWDNLQSFPDLYPYFMNIFDLRKGRVNISPTDPMQQILILMRILEELFFGLRSVSFGSFQGASGAVEKADATLGEIINNWRFYIERSFEREYLPRLSEYMRVLEGSPEERTSMYTRKLITELHWLKRLYYLPYYKFESLVPPPFQKGEIVSIYAKIKSLRKYFTIVAQGIDQGNRAGGAEAHATCEGIDNPWEPYVFEIPNPISRRLNALLAPKVRNNASLIYFCLAIITVLDKLVNSEDSWAYGDTGPLFRSVDNGGIIPLTGVDSKIDADALFRESIRKRQKAQG